MSSTGIANLTSLDLLTQDDETVNLALIEEASLSGEQAEALQEKLNNYLSFAIDGQLGRDYPETRGKQIRMQIDLYAKPTEVIFEFLKRYAGAVVQYGVLVEVRLDGKLVQ